MRSIEAIAAATVLTATAVGGLGSAPVAHASKDDVAINGTFHAASLGEWSHTNQQFRDQATVRATWTITSTCTTFQQCSGTVKSDQGWTEPLGTHDGIMWYLRHDVPNWEPCQDGSSFTGKQTYFFYPVDTAGGVAYGSPVFAGTDKTIGPSGACGQNRWLVIEMPFRLDKVS